MGAGIAAVIISREKDMVAHFVQQRATSASTAQSLEALRVENNMIFRRLENRAVIRQGSGGRYYVDELSWQAVRSARRRLVVVVLLIAIFLLAFLFPVAKSLINADPAPPTQSNR